MFRRKTQALPASLTLPDGTEVALRRSARARRLVLSVSRATGAARLSLPPRATEADARAFLLSRSDWLARTQAALPQITRVVPGALLPIAGVPHEIAEAPLRHPQAAGGRLLVPAGRPAGPVAAAFLRERAREALTAACARHAAALPPCARPMTSLSLRDTRSRWGSCSGAGRLMFSWRLAMCPPEVLDYVAAHEVAHLVHMDHGPGFWAQVAALLPDHARHRDWLRRHGPALQAWQFA